MRREDLQAAIAAFDTIFGAALGFSIMVALLEQHGYPLRTIFSPPMIWAVVLVTCVSGLLYRAANRLTDTFRGKR